jgi:hypothetical protein
MAGVTLSPGTWKVKARTEKQKSDKQTFSGADDGFIHASSKLRQKAQSLGHCQVNIVS